MNFFALVCVWIVVAAGSVILLAFTAYFAITIWLMAKEALKARQPEVLPASVSISPAVSSRPKEKSCVHCGGTLGPVLEGVLLNDRVYERRECVSCKQSVLIGAPEEGGLNRSIENQS